MIKQTLRSGILQVAFSAQAACVTDPPDIGDIGPSSHLVCAELERQFPGAAMAVTGRAVHSPTTVSPWTSRSAVNRWNCAMTCPATIGGSTGRVRASRMFLR